MDQLSRHRPEVEATVSVSEFDMSNRRLLMESASSSTRLVTYESRAIGTQYGVVPNRESAQTERETERERERCYLKIYTVLTSSLHKLRQ